MSNETIEVMLLLVFGIAVFVTFWLIEEAYKDRIKIRGVMPKHRLKLNQYENLIVKHVQNSDNVAMFELLKLFEERNKHFEIIAIAFIEIYVADILLKLTDEEYAIATVNCSDFLECDSVNDRLDEIFIHYFSRSLVDSIPRRF